MTTEENKKIAEVLLSLTPGGKAKRVNFFTQKSKHGCCIDLCEEEWAVILIHPKLVEKFILACENHASMFLKIGWEEV